MSKAYEFALRCLTRREYGANELLAKLIQQGFSSEESQDALMRCQALNYQNEAHFVESFCCVRIQQGYGPVRIQKELIMRGVEKELTQEILAKLAVCWKEEAQKIIQKKFKKMAKPHSLEWQKQQRFLLYRGFNMNIMAELCADI